MSVSSRALVEMILLGPMNDRRQLQDSPILGDVWIAFAVKPGQPMDLLITPYKERPAGPVAVLIAKEVRKLKVPRATGQEAQVAYLQGLVAARLFFEEVLRVIVPMTKWWQERKVEEALGAYADDGTLEKKIQTVINWVREENEEKRDGLAEELAGFTALDRYVVLAGIILWTARRNTSSDAPPDAGGRAPKKGKKPDPLSDALKRLKKPDAIISVLREVLAEIKDAERVKEPQVWQVSLNRKAMPALDRSVPAVKGDAARTLFNVRCDMIRWAVLDSGIDGAHDAFKDKNGKSRVERAFDFSNIRKIVSLDNEETDTPEFEARVKELLKTPKNPPAEAEAANILEQLAADAANDRPIHWELVEKFIEIDPATPPRGGHGTHVAGIIGADSGAGRRPAAPQPVAPRPADAAVAPPADVSASQSEDLGGTSSDDATAAQALDGMCPDIKFYDFRVLARTLEDTEFAIIAALQYLRYLNDRHTYITIHGANLSLSIPHDVRNFACGRTPICNECERLVESGVVVVSAAGNLGYQRFETQEGSYEGYTAFSITDPGNADGVITVGATHRYRPHTYGVSFFSSRGPTGDGRLKPDLVAPGERIMSSLPNNGWGELDGTSMAAPHVSGAAAMLMARYTELIGEPRRIKRILCESATDLNRERSFQGHGMLDVLRAFQSI